MLKETATMRQSLGGLLRDFSVLRKRLRPVKRETRIVEEETKLLKKESDCDVYTNDMIDTLHKFGDNIVLKVWCMDKNKEDVMCPMQFSSLTTFTPFNPHLSSFSTKPSLRRTKTAKHRDLLPLKSHSDTDCRLLRRNEEEEDSD